VAPVHFAANIRATAVPNCTGNEPFTVDTIRTFVDWAAYVPSRPTGRELSQRPTSVPPIRMTRELLAVAGWAYSPSNRLVAAEDTARSVGVKLVRLHWLWKVKLWTLIFWGILRRGSWLVEPILYSQPDKIGEVGRVPGDKDEVVGGGDGRDLPIGKRGRTSHQA
jgi:hypothetical protein